MWIAIIIFSIILAYLFRIVAIRNSFKKIGIRLSIVDSFKILYLLTKNYFTQLINLHKNKQRSERKVLNNIFWFFFDTLLVSLTSIIKNALELEKEKKISVVKVSSKNSIVKNVSETIPCLNETMSSAA
jgi:hypothetical protein